MNIGIIGAGKMGAALAALWIQAGHHVMISFARDSQKLTNLAQSLGAKAGSPLEAGTFGEVVMLAVFPDAIGLALDQAGNLAGKIVISCVSPFSPDFSGQKVGMAATIALETSMAEELARRLPQAKIIEAFNLTFAEVLQRSSRSWGLDSPSLPYCGDDPVAKTVAAQLITDCGFVPVDLGVLTTARSLELLASAWVQTAVVGGLFPNVALKILR